MYIVYLCIYTHTHIYRHMYIQIHMFSLSLTHSLSSYWLEVVDLVRWLSKSSWHIWVRQSHDSQRVRDIYEFVMYMSLVTWLVWLFLHDSQESCPQIHQILLNLFDWLSRALSLARVFSISLSHTHTHTHTLSRLLSLSLSLSFSPSQLTAFWWSI